jgi:hypothetical protein
MCAAPERFDAESSLALAVLQDHLRFGVQLQRL